MAKSKEQRMSEVWERARLRFDRIQPNVREERMQCLQDRRFAMIAGAQWEDALGKQFENLPRFEVNKIQLSLMRIFSEYRNNRISVDFRDKLGKDTDLSDALDGLYRADEQDSGAQEAYDNAFDEAVAGGMGAWRLRADYENPDDPDDERQRIRMEAITDADSCVFFDLNAKRQDKSDATHAFVLTGMPVEDYKSEYGDDPASWPKDITQQYFDWSSGDTVYIAEYYEIEKKTKLWHVFKGLDGQETKIEDDDLEEQEETLRITGFVKVREKRITIPKVHKYILSGGGVLEDCGYIAGRNIPIVPIYGKRAVIDGIERCSGHVRLAKDAQRLKNMQLSRLGEIAALSPIEKPIFTPEQVAGHQLQWADDNIKRYPYLLVNQVTDANGTSIPTGPLGYTKPPSIPPALGALIQQSDVDIQELLGNQKAAEQMQSNVSAKAVELIHSRLDQQTFIYMDNMAKAMKRSGEIWFSMAQELYIEEGREMKVVGEEQDADMITLMAPTYDAENGLIDYTNDLTKAMMDIVVDVGPSSTTRRDATVRALTGMLTVVGGSDPELTQILSGAAMMNMDGEGLDDVRDYIRQKMVRMGVVKPTKEEQEKLAQEAANQQPDAQTQYLQAAATEAQAKGQKAQADTVKALAEAEKIKADTVLTLSKVGTEEQNQVIGAVNAIRGV